MGEMIVEKKKYQFYYKFCRSHWRSANTLQWAIRIFSSPMNGRSNVIDMVAPLSASETLYDFSIRMVLALFLSFFLSSSYASRKCRQQQYSNKIYSHHNSFCKRSLVLTFFSCQIVNRLKHTIHSLDTINIHLNSCKRFCKWLSSLLKKNEIFVYWYFSLDWKRSFFFVSRL